MAANASQNEATTGSSTLQSQRFRGKLKNAQYQTILTYDMLEPIKEGGEAKVFQYVLVPDPRGALF